MYLKIFPLLKFEIRNMSVNTLTTDYMYRFPILCELAVSYSNAIILKTKNFFSGF